MLARGPLATSRATRPRLVVAESSGTPRPVGTIPGRTSLRPLVPEAAALSSVAVAALGTFAVAGDAAQVAAAVRKRFGDVITRISLSTPYTPDRADLAAVAAALRTPQ